MTRKPSVAAQQQQQRGAGVTRTTTTTLIKRGAWTPEEDELLSRAVAKEGEGRWRTLPRRAGLLRCGKSCRLRWMNYLRPDIKRGPIAADEEDLILRLHRLLGNRWSLIAGRLPGRTDNEIKNYWNSHLSKKLVARGIDPRTHTPLIPTPAAGSADKTIATPLPAEVVEPPIAAAAPPPARPSSSSSGAGGVGVGVVGGDFDGGMMGGLDGADGLFEGFGGGDPFCAPDVAAARGGFDWGFPVVDDVAFSSFLDSLMNEERIADDYFGDRNDADDENDNQGGA